MLKVLTRARAADRDGIVTRSIVVRPNTFDAAARTFTGAVLATARPIRVRGGIEETLDFAGARLPESLPLLLDHRSDVRSTVGRVANLRMQGDELLGDGRMTADPSTDWLAARIGDGTVGSLSIAYVAERTRDSGARSRTVVPRLLHVSLVSEPADDRAGIRSLDDHDDDPDDRDGDRDRGDDGANRNRRILDLVRALELPRAIEERAIRENWSDRQIMDAVIERSGGNVRATRGHVTLDDPAFYRPAAIDFIVCRITGAEPQGPARELAGISWADFHGQHLRRAGQSVAGLSDQEKIFRALATSDLPILAGSAINIAIRRTYEAAVSPLAVCFGTRDLPDFRQRIEALVDWTPLAVGRIPENGEYQTSYVTETGETISLYTLGGITNLSRQLWVNGAGALGNLSTAQGRRLAADVSDRMVGYIVQAAGAGPDMSDRAPVFSAAPAGRGNVLDLDNTDIASIIEGVLAARAAMPKRVGAGNVTIGQFPRYWVVPTEFEGEAVRALATINPTASADVNPLTGRLEVIPEPRLVDPDTSYLVCAPATMDGAVRVSLSGQPGPYTESRWGFEIDAVQFKIRLDFGLGWLEWRSWTRLDHGAGT